MYSNFDKACLLITLILIISVILFFSFEIHYYLDCYKKIDKECEKNGYYRSGVYCYEDIPYETGLGKELVIRSGRMDNEVCQDV